jgi:hypothetical protein
MSWRRHLPQCTERCVDGCDIYELKVVLGSPVLPAEIAAERAQEERFKALARGELPA